MGSAPLRRLIPRRFLNFEGAPPAFVSITLTSLLVVTGMTILVPTLPLYAEAFGVSLPLVGLAVGIFSMGRIVTSLLGGIMAERFGSKPVALAGCALTLVAAVVAAVTDSFTVLLAARLFQGVGSALYVTAAMLLVLSLAPTDQVGRYLGMYQGTFMLGLALGPTVGGVVGSIWGLRAPFWAYAVMVGIAFATVAVRLPGGIALRTPSGAGEAGSDVKPGLWEALGKRTFLLIAVLTLLGFAVRGGLRTTLLPLSMDGRFGLSESEIGLALSLLAVGQILVLPHAGSLLDKRGRRVVMAVGGAAMAAVTSAILLSSGRVTLYSLVFVMGLTFGYSIPGATAVLGDVVAQSVRGRAVGLQRTAADVGQFLGPVAIGALIEHVSYGSAFLFTALLALLGCVGALLLPETRPSYPRGR